MTQKYATWIPGPTAFRVTVPKACDTPPNVKTGRVSMTAQWIGQHAPEPPACFSDRPSWVSYLISAQEGGLDVVKSIERRKPIDYCADCDTGHRIKMRSDPKGNRCFPVVMIRTRRPPTPRPVSWWDKPAAPVVGPQGGLWEDLMLPTIQAQPAPRRIALDPELTKALETAGNGDLRTGLMVLVAQWQRQHGA